MNKMSEFMENEYQKSLDFWNNWLAEKVDDACEENIDQENDWLQIGSVGLAEATAMMGTRNHVLDYGCGSGWASVIMVKKGCAHVTAVDVSENGVQASKEYATTFHVENQIDFIRITPQWLTKQKNEQYDGVFCSNVLDVVPTAVCETIIEGISHVSTKDALVMIGLNPYFEQEKIEKRGFDVKENNHLFVDGILRLVNRTDEEWKEMLEQYFDVVECRYFRWDGEPENVKRRIFILKKHIE